MRASQSEPESRSVVGPLPMVSVGLPVFNGAAVVSEAIRSILFQSFRNLELVVSDNHSSDATESICRHFAERDHRMTVCKKPRNIGPAANFQDVLSRARGGYFMWAAADDVWDLDYLQRAVAVLDSSPDIGFVFPSFKLSSVSLGMTTRRDTEPFCCIQSRDRRTRVIGFANLHHASHKCNLVYSLFRTDLIRDAVRQQSITNDGLLSMVVLGKTRGQTLPGNPFEKRYKRLWPGLWQTCLPSAVRSLLPRRSASMHRAIMSSKDASRDHFPEYAREFDVISAGYKEHHWLDGYKIVSPSVLALAENHHDQGA